MDERDEGTGACGVARSRCTLLNDMAGGQRRRLKSNFIEGCELAKAVCNGRVQRKRYHGGCFCYHSSFMVLNRIKILMWAPE